RLERKDQQSWHHEGAYNSREYAAHRRPPCRFASTWSGVPRNGRVVPSEDSLIPVSERDDAVKLLDRRRTVQNLIDRALLQPSHSQVNRDTAEDVFGNLLEDEITQLLTHHHDLEDARAAHEAGLEAGRATQAAMHTEIAMLVRIEFETEQNFFIGREGDPATGANLADQAL